MKLLFLILCGLFFIIGSCKKSSFNSTSTGVKGSILIIDDNNLPAGDYSGVSITSENPDIAGIEIDEKGQFDFPVLKNNSIPLVLNFSKIGYGTVKQYYTKSLLDSLKNHLVGSDNPNNLVLIPQSSVSVNTLSGTIDGNKFKMVYNVSVDHAKPNNGITVFLLKNNSQVSCNNWTGNIANSRTWTIPVIAGDNTYSFCINRTVNCNCEFLNSGDTVYLKVYGDTYSPFGNSYYYLQTDQQKFPGININGSSATISFIVP